jgi:CRP/FNR family transcriptional regulator
MTCGNRVCPFHELRAGIASVPVTDLHCLVENAVKQVYFDRGDVLFAQGEQSSSLFSLSSGLVKISHNASDGREQIVGISSPVKLLVGLQSINDDHYLYSAVAETRVIACKIRHRALLNAVRNNGEVAIQLIEALNAQLAHSRELMRVMGHKCASAKIASFIFLLIPESQQNGHAVKLPFSRGEMASLLGLSEETVCRQMAKMKRSGILYSPRGKIEVLDWDRLQAVADEMYVDNR